MAEAGGRGVDRPAQVEALDDRRRAQVDPLADQSGQLLVGAGSGAERVDASAKMMRSMFTPARAGKTPWP